MSEKYIKYTCIHRLMATKTISITEEAYGRLKAWKEGKDSFSDVINKLADKKVKWTDLAGLLTDKEADELEASIKENRIAWTRHTDQIARMMNNDSRHDIHNRPSKK
jgi:predicted CopG family antitoxin